MSSDRYYQYNQRTIVHSGKGCSKRLPKLFTGLGAKRILLLSDAGLKQVGVVEQIIDIFEKASSQDGPSLAGVYCDVAPDASFASVDGATAYAREVEADAILAIGGGSVMDAAKGVKYALHEEARHMRDILSGPLKMETWPTAKLITIPHIAVPTTSGTGAEISCVAVFYNEETSTKNSLVSTYISADIALLDPDFTLGLPPGLTASTGMDALTHALETVASPNANHMTYSRSIYAAQLIEKNLPKVIANGSNVEARADMMQASTMAMDAFSMTMGPAPVHNCAHAFGSLYHIPHGDANAVLLPIVMETLPELYIPCAARLASALNMDSTGKEGVSLLVDVVLKLRYLQENVNCSSDFSHWKIGPDGTEDLIQAIASDPLSNFYNIPEDKVRSIIGKAAG